MIIFQDLKTKDETKMFIDINSKQKRIDSNLILLLKSDFKWSIKSKEYAERIAVKIVLELIERGSLKERVYTGTASEKPGNKLRLTTLVSAITSNQLVGYKTHLFQENIDDLETPYKKINEVLGYLQKYLKNYYFGSIAPFFTENKGIRILFRLVRVIEKNRLANNLDFSMEDFFKDLGNILDENFRKQLESYYGEGGANRAVELILDKLQKTKPKDYAKLQRDLRVLSV